MGLGPSKITSQTPASQTPVSQTPVSQTPRPFHENENDHDVSSTTIEGSYIAQRLRSRRRPVNRKTPGKAAKHKQTKPSKVQTSKIGSEDKELLIKPDSTEITDETTTLQEPIAEVTCDQSGKKDKKSEAKNRDIELSAKDSISDKSAQSDMSRLERVLGSVDPMNGNATRRKRKSDVDREEYPSKKPKRMPRSPTPPKLENRPIKSILKKSHSERPESYAEETADTGGVLGFLKTFGFGRIFNWFIQRRKRGSQRTEEKKKVVFDLPEYSHRNVRITRSNRRLMNTFNGRLIPQSTINKLAEPKKKLTRK